MRIHLIHRSAVCLLASTALAAPAMAQLASAPQMPRGRVIDANGVDLTTGSYVSPESQISLGADQASLVYSQRLVGGLWWINNFHIALETTATTAKLTIGTEAKTFNLSGTTYTPADADGSSLTYNSTTQVYTYTGRDGAVFTIPNNTRRASSIKYPNGSTATLYYDTNSVTGPPASTFYRLRSIGTSNGHQVRLTYALASMSNNASNYRAWAAPSNVRIVNNTTETCQASAATCSFTGTWPTIIYSGTNGLTITTPSGETRYTSAQFPAASGNYRVTGVKRSASAPSDNTTITYDANNRVAQIVTDGRTWTYSYSLSGSQMTTSITDPGETTPRVVVSDVNLGVLLSERDSLLRTTTYTYDSNGRLTRTTKPEGNYTQLTLDGRGNQTESRQVAKTSGTPPDIVTSATFPASCTNSLTCNKPVTSTDASGAVTDYSYDATHGGVISVTSPAPTPGAVRPQIRFGYEAKQAYFKNSAGTIVASGVPTWLLTSTSQCQTLASCSGAADEVKTTINFGPQTAGTANNLYPVGVSSGSGDGALTAAKSFTYDSTGNVTFVDGPLAGTVDRTRYYYNGARKVWAIVGPDPDGAGPLPFRSKRLTLADDLVVKTELGTTAGQGPFAMDNFEELQAVETYYDVSGRKLRDVLTSGGVKYALTQFSYDTKGRLQCTAQRMNPTAFDALPGSACDLGSTGPDGPDRIQKRIYDAADQVTQIQTGVGTTSAAVERTMTYTSNGNLRTLKDAENNLTTFDYDGHDRLITTLFPVAAKGANASSTTDYESLTYDVPNNVMWRRLRDGNWIGYDFDTLNRLVYKNLPGTEVDESFSYDNLGRLKWAVKGALGNTQTYDALGRQTFEAQQYGSVSRQFDLAGRVTRVVWSDGFYVDYDRLVTGEVSKIRENGATTGVGVLATYSFDGSGNRTGVTFGNGVVQAFAFDPVGRLASLTNDLSGSSNDYSVTFSRNAASQITSPARAGDQYSWTGPGSESRTYTSNGLNQYTVAGPLTLSYDAKGNLTSDGVNSFTYSADNLLMTGPNGSSLTYDPAMRLLQITSGSNTTRFAYSGSERVAEYNGSNILQRRYVHGPGSDQPLVWYEGTGTADRRFLSSDERGSIISITSSSGALLGVNKYDDFGIPQLDTGGNNVNLGRFQYTGQAWLPEVGLYYYKARMYSPTLGRFLQPDPVGYADGLNMYAYVGNEPINRIDPSGTTYTPRLTETICRAGSNCTINGMPSDQYWAAVNQVLDSGGTSAGGGWYCVSSCNNPRSGYDDDGNGSIDVYAPPQMVFVPGAPSFGLSYEIAARGPQGATPDYGRFPEGCIEISDTHCEMPLPDPPKEEGFICSLLPSSDAYEWAVIIEGGAASRGGPFGVFWGLVAAKDAAVGKLVKDNCEN